MAAGVLVATLAAQSGPPKQTTPTGKNGTPSPAVPVVTPPADYVIGVEDVLTIHVWGHPELSGDFTVRPDGKISLLVVNEVRAAGLTPEQLRIKLTEAVSKFYGDPTVAVNTKQINSRKVYIVGNVAKPGEYLLLEPMTVLQLITKAGGLLEYADKKNIAIVSTELRPDGQPLTYKFNYNDIFNQKNPKQNRQLKPGDQVLVR